MHIDYYCFPTKTGDISVYMDTDQYTNHREFIHYQYAKEDVLLAIEKSKLLLFDLRNNTFIDEKGNEVDISGKVIFPRSTIQEADILMEYLEKTDAKPITARKDYEIIENWFHTIKTKREFRITTLGELNENLDKYEKIYGKSMFIKTIQKGISGVHIIFDVNFDNKDGSKTAKKVLLDSTFHNFHLAHYSGDTPILIYPAVSILKDTYGRREWRAFVVNNELLCLSRFSDNVVPIEDYIYEKVKDKIKECEGKIPSSYVVDFFEYTDENNETIFDIVEFNPIIASGVFQNNDLVF
ncbi:MAG: hypothetical protein E7311_05525 [Clostridiales bacterium]|nr:hypothetical protein [Clostridiales bacterium]